MNKLLTIALITIAIPLASYAQGEIDKQQKVFYRNERTVAFSLNSNGYGISYREGKRLDYLNKKIVDIDFNILKHPKEIKLSNPWVQAGGSFIFGKVNSVYSLRGSIGQQHELFKKTDLGGVAIRYFYTGGPTFAITKPIYYNILYVTTGNMYELKIEKFSDDIHHPTDIYNKASFFKGFDEIKIYPGLFAKGGLNFEYSKEDKIIHALEVGVSLEAYPKKLPIMATNDNKAIYFTMFISYRLGIIVDPLNPQSNKIPSLFFKR